MYILRQILAAVVVLAMWAGLGVVLFLWASA